MSDGVNFNQEKIDREKPSLDELIDSLNSHNCDPNRPELGQQPKRSAMMIEGLTRRDIQDCMVLGILECKEGGDFPRVYVGSEGTLFKNWEEFKQSKEDWKDSYIDPERVTYNDLYGWDLDKIDPIAAVQNMACYLERRMGVFPCLLDGKLTIE